MPLAAALIIGSAFPVAAHATAAIYVKIVAPGQPNPPSPVISADTMNANADTSGELITMSPGSYASVERSGLSTARLVALAGVAADKLTSMTVSDTRNALPLVRLSGAEATQGFNNPNPGDTSPSFALFGPADDRSCFTFIRPMRDTTTDDNQREAFACSTSGPLSNRDGDDVVLTVAAKVLATATPTAVPMTVKAGEPVKFTAGVTTLDGATVASGLTFTWDFGDKTTDDGRTRRHAYAQAGSYDVRVTARDANGNAGVSRDAVRVEVDPQPGGSGGDSGGAGGTPDTGGGTAPVTGLSSGARDAATRSPANLRPGRTTKKPSTSSSEGSGGSGGTSGSGGRGEASGGRGTQSQGVDGGVGASTRPDLGHVAGASRHRTRPSPHAPPARGELIGVLVDAGSLADVSAAEAATESTPQQLAAARASRGNGATAKWIGWIVQGALLVIVLAMGGVFEFRPGALYRRILTS